MSMLTEDDIRRIVREELDRAQVQLEKRHVEYGTICSYAAPMCWSMHRCMNCPHAFYRPIVSG